MSQQGSSDGNHGGGESRRSAAALIAMALSALGSHRVRAFDDATVALAQLCGTPEGERQVVTSTIDQVAAAVTQAWDRGWQPADVHRMAVRSLSVEEQSVAVDAMSDELARYAAATVDHRWTAQLADLDGGVWWPASQTWLDARRARGADWLSLLSHTVTVLHLLWTLPRIQRLTPLPGEALPRPTSVAQAPGSGPAPDERILTRVRMLLAKAESTTFEAEAETFTAGAQALMARHSIDAALLAAHARSAGGVEDEPEGHRIGIDTPYDGPKVTLLSEVARANRCRAIWTKDLGFATVIGYEADVEAVELLFTSLLVQANARMLAQGSRTDHRGRSRTRAFRSSFLTAYAHRIGERLREVADAEMESAAPAASQQGQQLVPIFAARNAKVEQSMSHWFPSLTQRTTRSVADAEGWHAGRSAADQAHLDGSVGRGEVGKRRTG
ncbi:DUF2786 domain-containing protein [Knoellia subterranea]|nr:DUF2786 domain-containing protein [Knoellia subterranea]